VRDSGGEAHEGGDGDGTAMGVTDLGSSTVAGARGLGGVSGKSVKSSKSMP
jgi:hypothetical protein